MGDGNTKADLAPNEFFCAACGAIFEMEGTPGDALAEFAENLPEHQLEADNYRLVCDDCYRILGL